MYKEFPHLRQKVVFAELGTPLSSEHYLGSPHSYGLAHTPARFRQVRAHGLVVAKRWLTAAFGSCRHCIGVALGSHADHRALPHGAGRRLLWRDGRDDRRVPDGDGYQAADCMAHAAHLGQPLATHKQWRATACDHPNHLFAGLTPDPPSAIVLINL